MCLFVSRCATNYFEVYFGDNWVITGLLHGGEDYVFRDSWKRLCISARLGNFYGVVKVYKFLPDSMSIAVVLRVVVLSDYLFS